MGKILSGTVRRLSLIYRILAMIVTSLLIVLMFPHEGGAEHYDYKVGAPWRGADLTAPFDFAVLKSAEDMKAEEDKERGEAILYYKRVENGKLKVESEEREVESGKWKVENGKLKVESGRLKRLIDSVHRVGYLEALDDEAWGPEGDDRRVVVLEGNVGHEYRMGDFVTSGELGEMMEKTGGVRLDSLLQPDYVLDRQRTALELESRLSQLSYTSELVMAGERIVGKGEVVTEEKGRRIAALEAEEQRRFMEGFNVWGQMAGQLLLAMISFVALYMFLLNTRHRILEDNRRVLMVLVTVLMAAAMEAMMVRMAPEWVLLVPMCVVPILMRVFFDMRAALYIHLTTVIVLANLVPNSFEFIFYQLVTGMMSIIAVRDLEKRAQFFVLSAVIFVSYSLIYTAGVLSQDTNFDSLQLERYLIFFLNAVLGGSKSFMGKNSFAELVNDNTLRHNRLTQQVDNFWTPSNPGGIYALYNANPAINPYRYENRSFLRLQDITLSYDLPKQWMRTIGIDGINVYMSCKNLLTITGWHGWDPEPNMTYQDINGQNRTTGSCYDNRPVMKSVTFGLNINL